MNDFEKRFYALMITLPADTTPERIKSNREKMLPLIAEAEKFKKAGYKNKALDEAIALFYHFLPEKEYIKAVGKKSTYNIDTLPQMLKESLANMIAEG